MPKAYLYTFRRTAQLLSVCLIDNKVSSSSTTTILATQSVRAAVPPILSADSRAFAFPSVVYNLIVLYIILVLVLEYTHNCTVHNIGSST